jgi:O-antigen/teichoic acid export membrane protein
MSLKKKVGSVFAFLLIAAVCELLTTIILGRQLTSEVFGKFKFIHTIVLLLWTLLVLGQNTTVIRTFSRQNFQVYDWRYFVTQCLKFSAFLGVLAAVGVAIIYGFWMESLFIFVAYIASVGIEFFSSVLRADQQYTRSILVSKAAPVIFFLFVLGLVGVFQMENFYGLLTLYTGVFLCALGFGFWSTRYIPAGTESVPFKKIKEGLWIFLIAITYSFLIRIDQFFIAKMLGYAQLGGYVAVISVTRGFELLAVALRFVLLPHYSQHVSRLPSSTLVKDSVTVAVAAGGLFILYLIGGEILLHIFFDGKFDAFAYLLPFLIIIGFMRVMQAIPIGLISARFSSKALRSYFVVCCCVLVAQILGCLYFIPMWGLKGAVYATTGAWMVRTILGYGFILKEGT